MPVFGPENGFEIECPDFSEVDEASKMSQSEAPPLARPNGPDEGEEDLKPCGDYKKQGENFQSPVHQKTKSCDSERSPIDLDEVFLVSGPMDDDDDSTTGSLFQDFHQDNDETPFEMVDRVRFFNNPNTALLDNDASMIPGSPFSKPGNRRSSRPTEPLTIAKYASSFAVLITIGWVIALFYVAVWDTQSIGQALVEGMMAIISFFGLFWNTFFICSSVAKCFIPAKAFQTNTKYCSIIPETKPPDAKWMTVTIQIPVYKESLQEVIIPTLKSCMMARDHYIENTHGAHCNIVVCDDGMMAFLHDNFAAAEMLWNAILESKGRKIKLSKLLKTVSPSARNHLRGMRSKNVYEAFHRMLFYYHTNVGFVARSTVDRKGKFKKASNLNSHLQLVLGSEQLVEKEGLSYSDALLKEALNGDGSRQIMFGNNVRLGNLICVNDADARMAESVIIKTVPEFLNDPCLGFTQHATKTMTEQRGDSFYTNMLAVYTDALYQGHFLLSSVMGCHPPLVGHSIFLRTDAIQQCGRMRMLRHAQRWLRNIGLPFLPVDQVGFGNLQANNKAEYWSESHVSEDFELMINLYNLGFNGRYCAFPNCEFEEGITRTFDEEAGRHRKFALGAHELIFNPFQEMIGHGIFTPLFRTFISCDIPSYYKIYLSAYLCSYTSGGSYLLVFSIASIAHLVGAEDAVESISYFSPAGIIVLNVIAFYIIGYVTFLLSMIRMYCINNQLLFPEYRKAYCGALRLVMVKIRYCFVFQFFFYTVASVTFYFLGSMDHLLSRPNICSTTNKDSIKMNRCRAFYEMAKFNVGSWGVAVFVGGLAYLVLLEDEGWKQHGIPENLWDHLLFSLPALLMSAMCFISPILLNPYILGWPFLHEHKAQKTRKTSGRENQGNEYEPAFQELDENSPTQSKQSNVIGLCAFMSAEELDNEIDRVQNKPDLELGTVRDLFSADGSSPLPTTPKRMIHPALMGQHYSDHHSTSSEQMDVLLHLPKAYSKPKKDSPSPPPARGTLHPLSAQILNKQNSAPATSTPSDLPILNNKKARKLTPTTLPNVFDV